MTTTHRLSGLLAGPPEDAAPHLLGSFLISNIDDRLVKLRITEVEAYKGSDDPASHAFKGQTERNKSMFGRPGTLYCYKSYGIHTCANTAAGPEGVGWGILIRGGQVVEGEGVARQRRGRLDDLANGPGKVCQALGITLDHNGLDLFNDDSKLRLELGSQPEVVMATPRVGISKGKERPWRFVAAEQVTT